MKKLAALLAVLALASVGLVACGGDDDDGGDDTTAVETTTDEATDTGAAAGGGGTIDISAPESGEIAYDQSEVEVAAGPATINFSNPSQLPHDVAIESADGEEVGKTAVVSGGEASGTAELEPGTYTFYCTVSGHRDQGMEGTITVK